MLRSEAKHRRLYSFFTRHETAIICFASSPTTEEFLNYSLVQVQFIAWGAAPELSSANAVAKNKARSEAKNFPQTKFNTDRS